MILEIVSLTGLVSSSILVIYAVNYSLSILNEKRKYKNIPGANSNGIIEFFVGDVGEIKKGMDNGNPFIVTLAQNISKYGKTFKFRLFNKTMIFTTDTKVIKEVFIDQNCAKDPRSYDIIAFPGGERFMGHGLVTDLDNTRWKNRRGFFNPGFHKQALISFLNEFNSKGDILMNHLRKIADGKTEVRLLDQFNRTALDVIASVAFSMNIDSINDPSNDFTTYVNQSLAGLMMYFRDPLAKFKPHKWLAIYRYKKVLRFLRKVGRDQIIARLKAIKNEEYLPNDILTTILNSHKNEAFDIEDLVDDFVTFFIAGQETTGTTLSFVFLELGRNPEVLKKLKEEIDTVIGSKAELKYEDLNELKYTSCVFKETLRLYPPATSMSRITNKVIQLEDFDIPEGSWISLSTYGCGRSECYFPEPLKFQPERFLKVDTDSENTPMSYKYFPFSLGPRNCIGQNFAQLEAKIIMTKFIQNFDFKLLPNQSFGITQEGTLSPTDRTKCFITLRDE